MVTAQRVESRSAVVGVGDLIKRRRLSLGYSQRQLCDMVDIDQPHLSQIERGYIRKPAEPLLRRFAAALDLPEDELFRAAGMVVDVRGAAETGWVPYYGKVPADSVRWVAFEQKGASVEVFQSWIDQARSPLFAVVVSGDCLRGCNPPIGDGDVVVCESRDDRRSVRNGTIVLLRVEAEYSLKVWFQLGPRIELRDGDGAVVHTLATSDDYEILGTFFDRFGGRFLNVRS